ncbi:MAG: patatin family protein [Coriobacteriales bacterium]|jgi:predicted patatin/cPLA2 family phospholipase|nr:patatin family protein [Coriobacteriales bacterium]
MDTALIFEGGGMRASNTAGVVLTLLENGINFKDVYGISAGSSHTVNYISRDALRARESFVDFIVRPHVAGVKEFLMGHGYFNAHYIYEVSGHANGIMPFDFDTFMENPADMHIDAFCLDTGETVHWSKADTPTLDALMTRVRASSTMPKIMPAVHLNGHTYLDGGLGDSWGIPLEQAKSDGYERFFIVRTQERTYRKQPATHTGVMRLLFAGHAIVADRTRERPAHYNAICDEIEELERSGAACVYYPEHMTVKNTTVDLPALQEAYKLGYEQSCQEVGKWKEFLNL